MATIQGYKRAGGRGMGEIEPGYGDRKPSPAPQSAAGYSGPDAAQGEFRGGFEAFADDMLSRAGGREFRGDERNSGWRFRENGPLRGLTMDQALTKVREIYGSMPDEQRRMWEGRANMTDVRSPRELQASRPPVASPDISNILSGPSPGKGTAGAAGVGAKSAGAGFGTPSGAGVVGAAAGGAMTFAGPQPARPSSIAGNPVSRTGLYSGTREQSGFSTDPASGQRAGTVRTSQGGTGYGFSGKFENLSPAQQSAMTAAGYKHDATKSGTINGIPAKQAISQAKSDADAAVNQARYAGPQAAGPMRRRA